MSKPIPTENGLPYIGKALSFLKSPIDEFGRIAIQYPDIMRMKFFGGYGYHIKHPDLVREVLITNARKFRKADLEMELMGKFLGNGLVTNNNWDSHKRQRKLAQPAFHMQRIAGYADTIADYTDAMLNEWQAGEVRDISEEMRQLTMYVVSKTLFDADRDGLATAVHEIGEAMDTFQRYTDDFFGLPIQIPMWVPTRKNRQFKAAKQFMDETLYEIIRQRRASGEDKGDLLSMLLMSQDDDGSGMSDQQLLDEVITLFAAGHETTSNALTWTWYLLSQHPEIMAKVQLEVDTVLDGRLPTLADLRELPYTLMVIKESMRVYPPVYALNGRIANEDVQIGDYLIPEGSYVVVSPWELHHDPRLFEQPERFDPERFSAENEPKIPRYAYLPFGAGPRVCIGNSFAMMEAHLILATMVQRFNFTLLPEQVIELQPQITLSSKHGLRMRVGNRERAMDLDVSADPESAEKDLTLA